MATILDEIKNWLNDITQGFKWSPSNVQAHSGIDIGLKYGTPIYAIHSGVINYSGVKAWGGQISELETAYGKPITDSYLHLSQEVVSQGQQVQAGQLIGYSGSPPTRQYGTGPHLHFEETLGNLAPYVTASNPWRPTAQSYPLNPVPLLQQTESVGGSGNTIPVLSGIGDLAGTLANQAITTATAPIAIAQGIQNLASQIQQFPQNVINSIGDNIKQSLGVSSFKDILIRALFIGFAFFLGMLGFLAIVAEVINQNKSEIQGAASTAAIAAA